MAIKQTKPSSPASKAPKSRTTASAEKSDNKRGSTSGSEAASREVAAAAQISCLMNAQYHAAREAHLDFIHRWIMFGIIVVGAGAITDVVSKDLRWLSGALGIATAILGALDLTFDLSNRARTHSMMKRRYFELLADFNEGYKKLSDVQACIHRYSADEEPVYHALLKLSWNSAQEMVFGDDADQYKIPVCHRYFKNFFRFEGNEYPVRKLK